MRKGIVTLGVIAIIAALLFAFGPIAYRLATDRGLKTADLVHGGNPATTDVNGSWNIITGAGSNRTQAGYTFNEILPGQRKTTSGRAENLQEQNITGGLTVENDKLVEALIEVRVDGISSDIEKRDINVRRNILHTEKYPTARFALTEPVDVGNVPDNGEVAEVKATGDLTLHGKTKHVTTPLKVLRTEDKVLIEGHVQINRADYGIESPQFVAAKIAEEGDIDLLLVFKKKQ